MWVFIGFKKKKTYKSENRDCYWFMKMCYYSPFGKCPSSLAQQVVPLPDLVTLRFSHVKCASEPPCGKKPQTRLDKSLMKSVHNKTCIEKWCRRLLIARVQLRLDLHLEIKITFTCSKKSLVCGFFPHPLCVVCCTLTCRRKSVYTELNRSGYWPLLDFLD